jgi:hypothetical protein
MSDINDAFRVPAPLGDGFDKFGATATQRPSPVLTFIVAMFALVAISSAVCAALGLIPWLTLYASFGEHPLPQAGVMLQGLIARLSLLAFAGLEIGAVASLVPNGFRRRRAGLPPRTRNRPHRVFALSGEFDAMRERLNHMRRHPDPGSVEADIIELAAQTRLQSRGLAKIYSEDKVTRAKSFLTQRQQEAQATEDQTGIARYAGDEIRNWLKDAEADER